MMKNELNIKQKIFAEFIRLELIKEALEYAKNANLTIEEQQNALKNKKEVI